MRSSWKRVLLSGALGAACAVGAAGRPAMPVTVAKVQGVRQSVSKRYVGNMVGVDDVSLVPRVSGVILEQRFANGDMVKKGQVLFVLEKTTYQAQHDAAKAKLAQCRAEYSFAKRNLERAVTMRKSKATSESAYDEAVRLEASSKAAVAAAEAGLLDAENNLGYTTIYAPFDGKAGKAALSPLNYVTPATGSLVSVVRLDELYVNFWISARDYLTMFNGSYAELRKHADLKIMLADDSIYRPAKPIQVVFVNNRMDKNTDTIMLRGLVANQDRKLLPDSLVTVILSRREGEEKAAVPVSAIINDGKRDYVYVVDKDNTVALRTVESGELQGSLQIINRGLAVGETVIVAGIHKAFPGGKVIPVPAEAEKK